MSNAAIQAAATEIVKRAEFVGGKERVQEIAVYGYQGQIRMADFGFADPSANDRFDALCAIQDEAKSVSAAW